MIQFKFVSLVSDIHLNNSKNGTEALLDDLLGNLYPSKFIRSRLSASMMSEATLAFGRGGASERPEKTTINNLMCQKNGL